MKGDFSRDTFSPRKHYNAVLMQQGRVQVDADWNEQRAIDRHRIETEARDLIGASGGPANNAGFEISVNTDGTTLEIGPGDYYVDGILCQNEEPVPFEEQVDLPGTKAIDILQDNLDVGLIYLDVWERHVTALDDNHIREVALGVPDTATRGRTVWQARVLRVVAATPDDVDLQDLLEEHVETILRMKELEDDPDTAELDELHDALVRTNNGILELLKVSCDSSFDDELKAAHPPSTGKLLARALPPASDESLCAVPPSAGYERLENQLYRVEVHRGGERGEATFKWSRDNGSVVTPVLGISTATNGEISEISVRDIGRDEALGFANGQYVELVEDASELDGQSGPLVQIVQITAVGAARHTISVNASSLPLPLRNIGQDTQEPHPFKLRRWDSDPGALEIPVQDEQFVELEGGVQVRFSPGRYNTGDYWLIPARTATGAIEWPENQFQPPAGINHHYSRLALVIAATVEERRQLLVLSDCRRLFPSLTELTSLFYLGGDGQQAGPRQRLPEPLIVGVANGDEPVPGAQVRFEVQTSATDPSDGHLEADGNVGQSVIATTDARGEARCVWTLAANQASQQTRASLVDGTHLTVYFNANPSAAGEAVTESIRIIGVFLAGEDLRLDSSVPVGALAEGIQVVCSEDSIIDERTVLNPRTRQRRPTCFVTLEMPFPLTPADRDFWGGDSVGFQPLILAADVEANGNTISWRPAGPTSEWLQERLFRRVEGTDQMLAHLTLKGNFIWDAERPRAYLDGEIFGVGSGDDPDIELQFPSGDGRRGGDFEMWFWLERP